MVPRGSCSVSAGLIWNRRYGPSTVPAITSSVPVPQVNRMRVAVPAGQSCNVPDRVRRVSVPSQTNPLLMQRERRPGHESIWTVPPTQISGLDMASRYRASVHPQSSKRVEVGIGVRLRDGLLDLGGVGFVQLIVEALECVSAFVGLGLHGQVLDYIEHRMHRGQRGEWRREAPERELAPHESPTEEGGAGQAHNCRKGRAVPTVTASRYRLM